MITETNKQQIAERLREYSERIGSQNKAANSLKAVSAGTISQVLNNNWDLISDEMWRSLGSQIGWKENDWAIVETRDYRLLMELQDDARINANVFGVVGEAGSGKSVAIRQYAENNKRVYLVQCAEYWNRKMFMGELLTVMGKDFSGWTVGEMMHEVVRGLKSQDQPLLILDEADKLSDQVLYFFITLYNYLEDNCGIILIATDHLEKRIKRGLKLNKKGYKEIYSRIGRRFIKLHGIGSTDITQVCLANGITDTQTIKEIIADCENDLRRVKRKIHAKKRSN
jgi:DNA transposition AAA+ family ATPase